ncbi:c-type cytochrome [Aristophania vespae]|uniref:c-type cytochrome n=1 Tax=Aristophania vespae TaxID=2697033 RepID=UPI0023511EBC|nr:cytochrome c [Aristophania vespae]UMM64242.1 Fructose dehydrogenase cytochrome subunit [Aristophania vespae]
MSFLFSRYTLCAVGTALSSLFFANLAQAEGAPTAAEQDLIKQGEYIATASDCKACHTARGGKPYAGGLVIATPVGKIVSTNITPSQKYGIGSWSEAQFAKAVRKGVSPTLGHLYPAMPYTSYSGISNSDIHALYVYFTKGVKSVDEEPKNKTALPFPFNIRASMIAWNLLFAGGHPTPDEDAAVGGARRGEYLAKTLAHCSTCHTPRNTFMAEKSSAYLGGSYNIQGWDAPNITSDPISGIGTWSNDEIVSYLRNGAAHGKSQAAGPMAEAVEFSLRHLTDSDLEAIAAYLKTVPPIRNPEQKHPAFSYSEAKAVDASELDYPIDRTPTAMENGTSLDGRRLYLNACATCHQTHGQGTQDQFYPSLTSNSAVGATSPRNLAMAILRGVDRQTNQGHVVMPAFADQLTDEQIAALTNYVTEHFGNPKLKVTAGDIKGYRSGK